jgi:DNA helicase II / ATP-dependent DNA helicase PcrA
VDTGELAEGLDSAQHEAVFSPATPLAVLAGAGSGKTRVLTRRIARRVSDGTADPMHCLALTFTRKAANELKGRLKHLDVGADSAVTSGTFHAVALNQLRSWWTQQNKIVPAITSHPMRLVEAALENLRLERSVKSRAVLSELSWAKSQGIGVDDYVHVVARIGRRPPLAPAQLQRIYAEYEQIKRRRKVIDFDDILLMAVEAMQSDRKFALAQRWKFRHFFVDEFQDLNAAQFSLLRAWMGDSNDLFVVGDVNQAIYGWNGADAGFLAQIERHFRSVRTIRLGSNYRSTNQILAAGSAVLPDSGYQSLGVVEEGEADGPAPEITGYIDERGEAIGIARRARKLHSTGIRWRDIAILVRTNAQRAPIEEALVEYSIPFHSGGGLAWMHDHGVRQILADLKTTSERKVAQAVGDIAEVIDTEGQRPSLVALLDIVKEFAAENPGMDIADFLAWLDVTSHHDAPTVSDSAIAVTTFHRAKGLEWPVVFLAGVEDGLVPFGSMDGPNVDEERRLFYVAITRSRRHLFISHAESRTLAKGLVERDRSRWLDDVERSARQSKPLSGSVAVAKPNLEAGRLALLDGAAADEPKHIPSAKQAVSDDVEVRIVSGLHEWRSGLARLNRVEPKLIMSDSTLATIAKSRPETEESLASVDGIGPIRAKSIGPEILRILDLATKSDAGG